MGKRTGGVRHEAAALNLATRPLTLTGALSIGFSPTQSGLYGAAAAFVQEYRL